MNPYKSGVRIFLLLGVLILALNIIEAIPNAISKGDFYTLLFSGLGIPLLLVLLGIVFNFNNILGRQDYSKVSKDIKGPIKGSIYLKYYPLWTAFGLGYFMDPNIKALRKLKILAIALTSFILIMFLITSLLALAVGENFFGYWTRLITCTIHNTCGPTTNILTEK